MTNIFKNSFAYKLIYIFQINDEIHKGLLKIGDTTLQTQKSIDNLPPNCKDLNQAAIKRIKQYTNTAGISPKLLHTELAIKTETDKDGKTVLKAFRDHDIHRILENSNIPKEKLKNSTSKEWFKIDLQTALKAIQAAKNNNPNLGNIKTDNFIPIIFRPEQEHAIEKTIKHFKSGNKMLWNAKMRFGKTLSALKVIKECNYEKTIIITHRPVVDAGWFEDFNKIFHGVDNYIYGSKNNGETIEHLLKSDKHFVYFASMQDLRGSSAVGGKFDKNDDVFKLNWDLVIVDEAHEGTTTALGDDVIKSIVKEDNGFETKFLALSGTPFNILNNYDDNIYTWDYIMEQQSKNEWDKLHFGDSNPYDELPELNIYTYDLGKVISDGRYVELEDKAFNFREFFRVWTGDLKSDRVPVPNGCNVGDFYHEADVWSFLNLITKNDNDSNYPYSKEEYRELFKHSLWMVPGVKEARALSKLMNKHPVFGSGAFNIVNVAGDGDEEEKSEDALKKVREAINKADSGYTITLSCGKLTTGVTVKEWTAVFMLSGSFSTSAANYLQTIFRVQSPCNIDGKVKKNCYVFDFAPDRTLKMVAESVALSTKAGKAKESDKKIMGEFLNYCPIISVDGTEMKKYDTNKLLQQLKRAYAERAVKNGFDDTNLYNDELLKLEEVDIERFNKLKGIIGSSKAAPKSREIDLNNQGFTDEEHEEIERINKKKKSERTPEEEEKLKKIKEQNKQKKKAISILRGISIRMPLLIYGADININEDITMNKLVDIVDDSSWNEFMPVGVTKEVFKSFIKYYDAEIFVAAGRKIRNTVMSADKLPPLERIKKISELFSYFKNPDKETVLTPWRVVNMHMSDCLGGYDFYDFEHNTLIEEPRYVDRGNVTDDTLANINAQILEINSKTGLYPLYVAYSIYRTKCAKFPQKDLTFELHQKLWNDTVENNVYVICKTPMAKQITKRTLVGYKNVKINAHYFEDLINMLKNKPKQFKDRVLKPNYWKKEGIKEMKFDAIVGNPPYQDSTSVNNRAGAIYPHFYDIARELTNIYSLISPARFLFNTGLTSKEWNKKMLSDPHLKVVRYEPDATNIFPNTDIKGGIAIMLRDSNVNFGAIEEFIPDEQLRKIARRFKKDPKGLSSIVYSGRSDLKFNNQFILDYPKSIDDRLKAIRKTHTDVTKLSPNEEFELKSSTFEVLPYVFLNEEPLNTSEYFKLLGLISLKRCYRWIPKKYMIPRYLENNNILKYKILLPESNGSGKLGEQLSTPIVVGPNVSSTPTFISIGKFDTKNEAENALKYIKTKLVRALLGILKKTQHNPSSVWGYVPLQDFTQNSDINWSKSIAEIDKQLYAKYGLTDDEIAFIEEKIKPME